SAAGRSDISGAGANPSTVTWTYDKDHFTPAWGIPEMRLRFAVDPIRGSDDMTRDPIVERAMATIAEKTIVNPGGAVAASGAPAAGAPAAAAPSGVTVSKPTVPTVGAAGAGAAAAPPPPPAPATATL